MNALKLILLPAVLSVALLSASCSRTPKLVILHVNDTHSHLEPERSMKLDGHGGAIERAAFIDSVRAAMGAENVLLLHAGDFNQGSSYYSEFGGSVEVKVVNAMAYDCMTLGNHEFDNGIENLASRLAKIDGPVFVCANLDLRHLELSEYIRPYAVFERGGHRIGIIGLGPDLTTVVSKTISSRIPQFDNVEVVNRYADVLRNDEKCDMVILLTHIGYDVDCALVPRIHGVDLLVGGHSHTRLDEFTVVDDADGKPVRIISDGCWGLEVGKIEVYN